MLKYMIILLDDAAVSFCHYEVKRESKFISEETLRKGILYAMKENLNIQFVYPRHELPQYVHELVETIDHTKIGVGDIKVYDGWPENFKQDEICVLRVGKEELMSRPLPAVLPKRLNIVLTDVETFKEEDFERYKAWLEQSVEIIKTNPQQVNILTDRIELDKMNNCNAGWESITLAPDGKFYVCPAFYQDGMERVGKLENGIDIKNPQLYRLDHAPICRICDAYHCKRCVWLNRKTTLEVNTPSHEQCVVSHLERNASRLFNPEKVKDIDYLDPFEKIQK